MLKQFIKLRNTLQVLGNGFFRICVEGNAQLFFTIAIEGFCLLVTRNRTKTKTDNLAKLAKKENE